MSSKPYLNPFFPSPQYLFVFSCSSTIRATGMVLNSLEKPTHRRCIFSHQQGDGSDKDTFATTVVDANGNTVADYNGNVTLTTTGNATAIVDPTNSANSASTETVAAKNGVATFTLESTGNAANVSDTLTGTADNNGAALAAGTTTVTTEAAKAQSVKLSATPSTLDVNQSGYSTTVNVSVLDQSGNVYSGTSEPVTLTLTGPGSFAAGSSVKTTTIYVDGTGSVYVYGTQNGTGTITVSGTSTGLTAGNTSINAITVGAPAKLAITSQAEKTSNGTPFTLYTVQLEDANGNAITGGTAANDFVELSDNTGTVGGTLNYYQYDSSNGQPGAALPMTTQLVNGQLQFAVENTSAGSSAATITVKDISQNPNFSVTAPYDFQIGSASSVTISPNTAGNVAAGQKVTFTAQLTDANGNDLKTAGQSVNFYFASNSANATLPNGLSGTGSGNGYTAVTNANGVATVTVTVPSGASVGDSFAVDAQVGSNAAVQGPTETVEALSALATGMQFSNDTFTGSGNNIPGSYTGWPTNNDAAAGTSYSPYVTLTNGVGESAGVGDQIQITTSDPSVLSLASNASGWTAVSGSNGASYTATVGANGTVALPTITAGMAGAATITVTDLSNPGVSPITETLNVSGTSTATGVTILYNGQPVSASNPVTLSPNTATELTVEQTGAGGNPVIVTGVNPLNVDLTAPSGDSYRLSSGGAGVNSVQIPAGSDQTSVYLVSPSSATYTALTAHREKGGAVTISGVTNDVSGNPVAASVPAGTLLTVAGQATATGGFGIPNATVTVMLGSTTQTATTDAQGYYTLDITPTTAIKSGSISATIDTLSNGLVTGNVSTAGTFALSVIGAPVATSTGHNYVTASATETAGLSYTVTVSPVDSAGNAVTGLGTTIGSANWNVTGATLNSVTANSNGTYTLGLTAPTTAGSNTLTVSYGSTELGSATQTITADVAAPAGLSATTGTAGGKDINLSWTAVTGAKSYNVYTSSSATGTYTLAGTSTSGSYTYSGTAAGATVYFEVAAVDTNNNVGPKSSDVSGTTPVAAAATVTVGTMTDGTYVSGADANASGTVTVTDQYGNPMTSLTDSSFTVTAGGTSYTGVSTAPTTAANDFTVSGGTNGQYTLTVYSSGATALSGSFTVKVGSASGTGTL